MEDIKLFLIAILSVSLIVVSVSWIYLDRNKETSKPVIHKLTAKSTSNSVNAVLNTRFKLPNRAPVIVWQDPQTGDELTEAFIMQQLPTEEMQNAAFKALKAKGMRRVYETCKGLTEPKHRWVLGYCTYEDASQTGLKG